MKNPYLISGRGIRSYSRASFVSVLVLISISLISQPKAESLNFDMTDLNGAGTGTGMGQAPGTGNTNVPFAEFGNYTPNPYPGGNPAAPADLYPVRQQYTTSTGLPINSYQATQLYNSVPATAATTSRPGMPGHLVQSGTANQTPRVGGVSTLSPANMAIQANYLPLAQIPINSSGQYSFGFLPSMAPTFYNGAYGNPLLSGQNVSPGTFNPMNSLPATSLGSMDFNIVTK